jgi:hypothetical protein
VEVSGILGNVTVGAEAGDVRVRDVGGDVKVEAPSGDVTVGDVNTDTGSANLEAGVGDVSLEDLILGTLEPASRPGTSPSQGVSPAAGESLWRPATLSPSFLRRIRGTLPSRRTSAASCASLRTEIRTDRVPNRTTSQGRSVPQV